MGSAQGLPFHPSNDSHPLALPVSKNIRVAPHPTRRNGKGSSDDCMQARGKAPLTVASLSPALSGLLVGAQEQPCKQSPIASPRRAAHLRLLLPPGPGEKASGDKSQPEPGRWVSLCAPRGTSFYACGRRIAGMVSSPLPSGASFSLSPVQLKHLQLFPPGAPSDGCSLPVFSLMDNRIHPSFPSLLPSLLPRGKRAGAPFFPSGDSSEGCSVGSAPPPHLMSAKEH